MAKKKQILISQSLIKDLMKTNTADPKEKFKPSFCPRWVKYRNIDGLRTEPSDLMLCGQYFEWHLLGATRDGIEPVLPKVGVKNLKPTQSASKAAMIDYVFQKLDSEKVLELPEKPTKEFLFDMIKGLPEDYSKGQPGEQEKRLMEVILIAKDILSYMGLNTFEGDKQLFVRSNDISGHLDWVTRDLKDDSIQAIYDVKWTKTKIDDWRNGWGEPETKEDAKLQAIHYTYLWYLKHGEYIPFYFIVFGDDGWIRVLRYRATPDSIQSHVNLIDFTREQIQQHEKEGWKPRPEFNRCMSCDFNEICDSRAMLPEIETIIC